MDRIDRMATSPGKPDSVALAAPRPIEPVRDLALFTVDRQGRVASWNDGVERILGWNREDWIGQPVTVAFTPEDVDAGLPAAEMQKAATTGLADGNRWMRRKNGEHFYTLGEMARVLDDQGVNVGYLKVLRDFTAHREAAQETERLLRSESEAWARADNQAAGFSAAIETLSDGVCIGDRHRVQRCNRAALDLLGLGSVDALQADGAVLVQRLRLRRERNGPLLDSADLPCARAARCEPVSMELWVARGGEAGEAADICLRCSAHPVRVDGVVVGAAAVFTDLTERLSLHRAGRALSQAETDLHERDAALHERDAALHERDAALHERDAELRALVDGVRDCGVCDTETVQHGLAAISRDARTQVQLIEDLLDMNRIQSGHLRLDLQRIELGGVIAAAIDAALPAATAKGIGLRTVFGAGSGQVMGDAARLQEVVGNLLNNAIKFTPQGGQVSVMLKQRDGGAELAVSDTGQGIAADFLPLIFQRFQQQDASITRRHGGLGIGLAIVRHLVALHGGQVQRRRRAASGRRPAGAPPAGALQAEPAGRSAAVVQLDGVRVLLVDDEPDVRAVTERVLQDAGAQVLVASQASQGLALLQQKMPTVILSDIGMPGIEATTSCAACAAWMPCTAA